MINPAEKRLSFWLLVSLCLIFSMVVLGGLTRLTGSGLSMVSWKPLTGFIPPLNTEDWVLLFKEYQTSPEFLKINFGMTLEEFKNIFWLEFIHRVLGRIIGIIFLIPVFLSVTQKALRSRYGLMTTSAWLLGGLQGALGWYMVKSGLVRDPEVSHYRLAAHLALAFTTFGLIFWTYLNLNAPRLLKGVQAIRPPYFIHQGVLHQGDASTSPETVIALQTLFVPTKVLFLTFGITCATIIYGAFVAGLKAGLIYNTFPTMNGAWVPDAFFDISFGWQSFFEEPGVVQWTHRVFALSTALAVTFVWSYSVRAQGPLKKALNFMFACLLIQIFLGITTLLMHVPVTLGTLHQAGALLLFSSILMVIHLSHFYRLFVQRQ